LFLKTLVFEKNANFFFAENWQKSQKKCFGDCFWGAVILNYRSSPKLLTRYFLQGINYVLISPIKLVGLHFGGYFHKLWSPGRKSSRLSNCIRFRNGRHGFKNRQYISFLENYSHAVEYNRLKMNCLCLLKKRNTGIGPIYIFFLKKVVKFFRISERKARPPNSRHKVAEPFSASQQPCRK
jgi:hypothetical protein